MKMKIKMKIKILNIITNIIYNLDKISKSISPVFILPILFLSIIIGFKPLQAKIYEADNLKDTLLSSISLVDPMNNSSYASVSKDDISNLCNKLNNSFKKYKWNLDPCSSINWKADLKTSQSNPLIYTEFGLGSRSTILMGGVHGDELVTIPIAFKLASYLKEHPEIYNNNDMKIIIAPLINPDGFFLDTPTRANINGVDLNRNFFTKDWYSLAKKKWQTRPGRNRDKRVFPGYFPNSEIETIFQIHLINKFLPNKILSMHAPLGFLDYDGPGKTVASTPKEIKAKNLVYSISEKSGNYKVVQYTYYPGSLGNYAGNERSIPTVTLEFVTEDPNKFESYWKTFLPGLMNYIKYDMEEIDPTIKSLFTHSYLKD